ncbi:Iron-sulfur cluster assembly scaffold protein IscU/NifU-like [hydrothermal vent metagenome]|uniref:Iron-sulfur cluster assembly scaffold protein IscU/NifU-like n=1 Tax=hydrothermal vent metagenome TaxID=652676 RepID=A0A1W1CFH9_9ZZZZ
MTADALVVEHMMNPRNYGKIEDSDSVGMGKNPQNGEKVAIYLKVKEGEDPLIEDISFQAIGCTTTIVAGSLITTEAKGIHFSRAEELVSATLGLLENQSPEDAACTEMVALALKASLDTYTERQKDKDFPMISYHINNDCTPKEESEDEKTV